MGIAIFAKNSKKSSVLLTVGGMSGYLTDLMKCYSLAQAKMKLELLNPKLFLNAFVERMPT